MPAKNSVKIPIENGYYHIYNRGVNKQNIFERAQDYSVFLKYLSDALSLPQKSDGLKTFEVNIRGVMFTKPKRQPKNFNEEIDLIAYALLPNHFHLLIRQNKRESMEAFMRSLATRYSMYFNKSQDRVGSLFQGIYKAILIENENYLLHLSRYIHLNPKENFKDIKSAYSSYANYVGDKSTEWVKTSHILSFFNQPTTSEFKKYNNYQNFVEKFDVDNQTGSNFLENIILEDE